MEFPGGKLTGNHERAETHFEHIFSHNYSVAHVALAWDPAGEKRIPDFVERFWSCYEAVCRLAGT